MAIAYPMRSGWLRSIGRGKKAIAVIWTVSAFLAIPSAIRIDYNYSNSLSGERVYWCMREFPEMFGASKKTLNRCFALYQLLLLIVFPVATMTVCYFRVAVIVCKSSKDRGLTPSVSILYSSTLSRVTTADGPQGLEYNALSNELATFSVQDTARISKCRRNNRIAESNKKQIIKMLIAIVVVYTICRTPSIVDELLTSFGYICRPSNTPTLKAMRMSFNAMAYCQSCINPICYAFMSQNFRSTFRSAYKRMRLRSRVSLSDAEQFFEQL
uniref:G_PROTEIN_RECEP_F1_2 domain-containing protein n=1 Tax=Syphacia muris TaxID=451379 RepID=A0A0N5A8J9_9BILA